MRATLPGEAQLNDWCDDQFVGTFEITFLFKLSTSSCTPASFEQALQVHPSALSNSHADAGRGTGEGTTVKLAPKAIRPVPGELLISAPATRVDQLGKQFEQPMFDE